MVVRILFLVPIAAGMVGACKIQGHVARAQSFRVRPFWPERRRMSRASTKCTEVLAGRHKSDCRSTAGEDQQGLRVCGLEGRRSMQ